MSALAHQKYTLSNWSFREIKHNSVPRNLFLTSVVPPDSEGVCAAGEAGVGNMFSDKFVAGDLRKPPKGPNISQVLLQLDEHFLFFKIHQEKFH